MERLSLRRDQRFQSLHDMNFGQQQWRPMTDDLLPSSRFRNVSDEFAPVLPRISSLLSGNSSSKELKRREEPAALHAPSQEPLRVANAARVVMYVPQHDEQLRVRRPSVHASTRDWDHYTPPPPAAPFDGGGQRIPAVSSAMRRAVHRELSSRRAIPSAEISTRYMQPRDPPKDPRGHDPVERRRLFYQHSVDPHKIHEIHIPAETPVVPHYRTELPRKLSRYHSQVSPSRPAYYEEDELELAAPKRRRVSPSLTPPTPSRQPLYEAEYGLAVLETSKPLMQSRYSLSMEHTTQPAPRRRYVRGNFEKTDSLATTRPRSSYNGSGSVTRIQTSAPPPAVAAPRTKAKVENRELVLKSKEFLKSKSLVRNRHDEIDWVATFLKVGFDSSSIYALMCPLRKGRWKSEEENYTMGLLKLIENGTILLRHGQSIRGYIGEKLHSDDMRVLKKLSNYKMFHFAKLINPRLAEEERLDRKVAGAEEGLEQLDQLKGEFLRSVQLEALVAVRKYLSDSSLRDLLNVRA
ncbi:hypothetical protein PRIC2_011529 [Phytophthora ramorum]